MATGMMALRPYFEVLTENLENDAFHDAYSTLDADILAQDTDAAQDRYAVAAEHKDYLVRVSKLGITPRWDYDFDQFTD